MKTSDVLLEGEQRIFIAKSYYSNRNLAIKTSDVFVQMV